MTASERTSKAGSGPPLVYRLWDLLMPLIHGVLIAVGAWAWGRGWWGLTAATWPAVVWLNHSALTGLHEAAHGTLSKIKAVNELRGVVIGTAALIPLSVYRYVHARHHAHLGGERDPEFWPYNLPGSPRTLRVAYAWLELVLGWVLTPLLYSVRTALSWPHVSSSQRWRLIAEWAFLLIAWAGVWTLIIRAGWLETAVMAFVVPAWGAGVFQTVRKFTEHLGMHGGTITSMTRTVVYQRPLGRLASASQLHVDHHGTHHRHARIPYHDLPEATPRVYGDERLYRSHLEAISDMLPHLLDPRVGPQWTRASNPQDPASG